MTTSRFAPDTALRVLTVCTGNLCRSPTAEQLVRARVDLDPSLLHLSSAGTLARDGDPMPERAAAWSRRLGGNPDWHRSRYLTPNILGSVDLVICMAREHRRAVVDLRPALVKVTFTLLEFARLASEVNDVDLHGAAGSVGLTTSSGDRLRATLPLLARARAPRAMPLQGALDDVVDPIGRAQEAYGQSARQIDAAVGQIVRVLRATVVPRI